MTIQSNHLALFGGAPLVSDHASLRIAWPIVSAEDRKSVWAAFERSDFSGRGSDEVRRLETEFAQYVGMPVGSALNSCTAALHAALHTFGVGPGDEVIVPNFTFIACAMAVIHAGATPVFADVDVDTYNVTAETISQCITDKTKAVIVVHMHGIPAPVDEITRLCHSLGIKVIEDVAQAPGATLGGAKVGSFGDASVFSLMAQKNIATCGECGILLLRSTEEKNRADMLRIYGEVIGADGSRSYNSYTIGFNYTLNPIQAAMARSQLRAYPELLERIRAAGLRLTKDLARFGWVRGPYDSEDAKGVMHFYRMRLTSPDISNCSHKRFRAVIQLALNAEGLCVRHYQNVPLPMQPVFNVGRHKQHGEPVSLCGALDVIGRTFVLGAIGSSPSYLLRPGTVEAYVAGFEKINGQMDKLLEYARSMSYTDPWSTTPVVSDSYQSKYRVLHAIPN